MQSLTTNSYTASQCVLPNGKWNSSGINQMRYHPFTHFLIITHPPTLLYIPFSAFFLPQYHIIITIQQSKCTQNFYHSYMIVHVGEGIQ
jgi:hypothetical protein